MDILKRQRRHHRIRARLQGTPARPRVSVFRSNRLLQVQLIDDTAGKTLLWATTTATTKTPKVKQAQQLGHDIASQAKAAGITAIVFDRSGYQYHGRVKALAEAMRAGGLLF